MTRADRREAIVERLAAYLLENGLGAASLRPLAAAAGTSDRMLIYYFGDKDGVLTESLRFAASKLRERLPPPEGQQGVAPEALLPVLLALAADASVLPFMRLWLDLAASAARGDRLCQSVGQEIARNLQDWIADRLAISDKALRSDAARDLLRTVEGEMLLQTFGV